MNRQGQTDGMAGRGPLIAGGMLVALAVVAAGWGVAVCRPWVAARVPTPDYAALSSRLDTAMATVERLRDKGRAPLDVRRLATNSLGGMPPPVVESTRELGFHVQGVIRSAGNPLVIIDNRLHGLGEQLQGFKIVGIADDRVTFEDAKGQRWTVALYKAKFPVP